MAKTTKIQGRRPRTGLDPAVRVSMSFADSEPVTQQHFRDECDINLMMKRYQRTGILPGDPGRALVGSYGDFSEVPEYREALEIIRRAESQFQALPAMVRDRFKNDPAQLLAFVQDKGNREEAIKLGLIEAPPEKAEPSTAKPAGGAGGDTPPKAGA